MLAAVAAGIHAVEAPRHFAEWWGYGLFFVVTAFGQSALAVVLLQPARHASRWIGAAGIAGNVGVAVLYMFTRTVGIPFVGPAAGEVEAFDRSGLVATLTEVVLVIALVLRQRTLGTLAPALESGSPIGVRGAARPRTAVYSTAGVALLTLVGIVTIEALPGVIAAQEGGSGPGSALLLGQGVQVACTVLGAVLSIHSRGRHPLPSQMKVPAVLLALAVGAVFVNEHADLGWIVVVGALAGLSLGWLLTAALLHAMSAPATVRPACVGLVLMAPVVARAATGWMGGTGLLGIALAALVLLAATMVAGRSTPHAAEAPARVGLPRRSLLAAGIVAVGVIAVLAGTDPSRVLTTMLARPVGMNFNAIDDWRSGFLMIGAALVLGGSTAVGRRAALGPVVAGAVAGLALLGLTASGAGALLVTSVPTGPIVPAERTVGVVALAGLVGTGSGIALAALPGVAHRRPSLTATVGAAILAVACAAVATILSGANPGLAAASALSAVVGLGAGTSSAALWLSVAELHASKRGFAVALGTAAAAVGLALGPPLARGAAGPPTGADAGMASGGFVVGVAAMAALAAIALHGALTAYPRASERYDPSR